jgi:1,4-alpha-glucan branching enzyme
MVTPKFKPAMGGAEEYIYQLSKRLIKRGHEVVIYTSDLLATFPQYSYTTKGDSDYDGIPVRRFHAYRLLRNYPVVPGMIPALMREEADIIHAHVYGQFTTDFVALVSAIRRVPLIFTPQGFALQHPLKRVYIRLSKMTTLKAFTRVICPSTSELKQFAQLVHPDKTIRIPEGIDIAFWQTSPQGSFREKHKIGGPLIAGVGRLLYRKGFQHVIQAMPAVLQRFPEATLVIGGQDFGYLKELEGLTSELKVERSVVFTGPLSTEEVRELLAAADVVVIPSIYGEGQPSVLLEAMASGKPIVASVADWSLDMIMPGENGLLVEPGDSTGLGNAIITLLEDSALSARMASINRDEAKKYSWDAMAEEIKGLYYECLGQRGRV